jgi:hypothetical protein
MELKIFTMTIQNINKFDITNMFSFIIKEQLFKSKISC